MPYHLATAPLNHLTPPPCNRCTELQETKNPPARTPRRWVKKSLDGVGTLPCFADSSHARGHPGASPTTTDRANGPGNGYETHLHDARKESYRCQSRTAISLGGTTTPIPKTLQSELFVSPLLLTKNKSAGLSTLAGWISAVSRGLQF